MFLVAEKNPFQLVCLNHQLLSGPKFTYTRGCKPLGSCDCIWDMNLKFSTIILLYMFTGTQLLCCNLNSRDIKYTPWQRNTDSQREFLGWSCTMTGLVCDDLHQKVVACCRGAQPPAFWAFCFWNGTSSLSSLPFFSPPSLALRHSSWPMPPLVILFMLVCWSSLVRLWTTATCPSGWWTIWVWLTGRRWSSNT